MASSHKNIAPYKLVDWSLFEANHLIFNFGAEEGWQDVKRRRSAAHRALATAKPQEVSALISEMSADDLEDFCSCPITQARSEWHPLLLTTSSWWLWEASESELIILVRNLSAGWPSLSTLHQMTTFKRACIQLPSPPCTLYTEPDKAFVLAGYYDRPLSWQLWASYSWIFTFDLVSWCNTRECLLVPQNSRNPQGSITFLHARFLMQGKYESSCIKLLACCA